jgi:hypothetical protein
MYPFTLVPTAKLLCVCQVEVEIQRYAVLALANLGTTVANHHAMMEEVRARAYR